jgi:hypothetical protein
VDDGTDYKNGDIMLARANATAVRSEQDDFDPAMTSGRSVGGRFVVGDLAGRVAAVMKSAARPDLSKNLSAPEIPSPDQPSLVSRFTAAVKVQETPSGFAASYVTLQEWEGCVDRVEQDTVFARLRNITSGASELSDTAEIPLDEIAPDDVPRLVPGSLFRWAIGYRRSSGVQERFSRIIVRHLPSWTQKDLTEAESFSRKHRALFQDPDAQSA